MFKKIISLTLTLSFLLQQTVFAYTANLNLSNYLNSGANLTALDRFRPISLRYFSYQPLTNDFKVLLDKGDTKDIADSNLKGSASVLLDYFKIGLTLSNDKFWVNLRPDSEDEIIDEELAKTDLGKVMLEADLKLKQDTSLFTSPQSPQGKEYWNRLYKKAGELFGTENITIPTLTRPWIVPGEIILRESADKANNGSGAYIYKANLKVLLEDDYLTSRGERPFAPTYKQYEFNDPRLKELNQYSTQLIRELILPRLTQKVNSSKDYANLRQVYFSLILARWFKETFSPQSTVHSPQNNDSYVKLINSNNLTNLTSKTPWDKTTYFNAYQKSFQEGEYNLSEPIYTPTGQVIRRYMSGGILIKTNPGIFTVEGDPTSSAAEDKDKILLLNGKEVRKADQGQIEKTAASAMVEEGKLPLTQPRLNFSDLKSLEASLKGIVEVSGAIYAGTFKVINESALRSELIDKLVYDATFNPNQDIVDLTRWLIKGIAVSLNAKPSSTFDLYLEKSKDPRHYTIPAINIRGMAYNTARAVFESAVRNKVEDPFILEIARSEIGYTAQRPAEYTTSILAAAIKEGYKLPVYLQGDHFQITAKEHKENLPAAMEKVQKLIREAIEAGFYQIDLDTSTLVDWSKPTADEQQNLNYTMAAKLTAYVRQLEKDLGLDKQGIVVNLGGEIGEIGMGLEKGKERNSSVEDLRAFMNGYNAELEKLGKELGFKLNPITKVAVQSGTKHGGVRDSAGKVIKAKVGFNTLAELGKAAREEFGLAGVVQHGASTLPEDYFTVFAGNKMPTGLTIDESLLNQEGQTTLDSHPVAEVHLATAYQDTVLDHPEFPADLREEIVKRILEWNPPKEGQDPNKVFVDNRKNAWGEFKLQTWNMPSDIQTAIRNSLRAQFDTVFKNLGVASSAVEIMVLANNLSLLEGAQTRGYNVSHAILDKYNGGILNHSEARFNLEVKIENALKSIFSESYNYKDPLLALAPAEEKVWKQTLKTEGISDAEYVEYFSFEKDEYLSRPHIGVTNKARHIVNMIINLQLKKVIASTRGDKGYKNVRQVVLCVGETLAQREPARKNIILDEDAVNTLIQEGMINAVIEEDIKDMLKGITKEDARSIGLRIAYEPRWAIGTGKTPTTDEIQRVHRFIKYTLSQGSVLGIELDVDYGGSLKSKNAGEILHLPDVDGGLIGGAAKTVGEIEPIIKEAIIQGEKKGKILNIGMNWKAETEGTGLASLESFAEFFKNSSLDLSKVTIAIGTPQVGIVKSAIASSAIMAAEKTIVPGQPAKVLGGIDFRQMNMLIQPQGSFASSSLDFSLPALSRAEIESFDLDTELAAIQRMADSGIAPSYQRLKEYLAVCFAKERTGNDIDNLKLCLLDIFEKEQFEAKETPDGYKEVLVIADTRGYVLREDRLAAIGQNAVNLN